MDATVRPPAWKTMLAFAVIYFVWGSTFLAIRVGVREVPPLVFCLHAVLYCRGCALWLDAPQGHAVPEWAPMGRTLRTRILHLCFGLWPALLGRATRALRNRRSHARNHPGFYGAFGNSLSAHAAACRAPGVRLA